MQHSCQRGAALLDVVLGGVVLAIGMTVVLSLTSRSIAWQSDGEHRLVASWLADELLSMVVIEGPREYSRIYETQGKFDPPYDKYEFELDIQELSITEPYLVTAKVMWDAGRDKQSIEAQTYIAERAGEELDRMPVEPIDRISRYYEQEEEASSGGGKE